MKMEKIIGVVFSQEKAQQPKMEKTIVQVRLRERIGEWTSKQYDCITVVPLAIDDVVVVDTQYGPQLGIVSGHEKATGRCLKYVIQKVDFSTIEGIIAQEQAVAELKKKITARANVVRKQQELAFLATQDKELAELLEQLFIVERDL